MKYKHKITIGDSWDIAYPVHGRIKTEEAQLEMAEVYRKAEAFDKIESIHLNMFGDTVCEITEEEAENFGMSVMRVLKIGGEVE